MVLYVFGNDISDKPNRCSELEIVGYAKLLDDTQTPYVKHNNEHIINIKKKIRERKRERRK